MAHPTALPLLFSRPALVFARWLASWARMIHLGALLLVVALSPSTHDRGQRALTARQVCITARQVLPGFTLLSVLLCIALTRIVAVTAYSYGLSRYATEMVIRVLVLELIPLSAALFVALRAGATTADDAHAWATAGLEHGRGEIVARVVASGFGVVSLAAISGAFALSIAYLGVYGFSAGGLAGFSHTVGRVFDLAVGLGFALKLLLFSLAVAVIPIAAGLDRRSRASDPPGLMVPGMVRLFVVLLLVEGASLVVKYA